MHRSPTNRPTPAAGAKGIKQGLAKTVCLAVLMSSAPVASAVYAAPTATEDGYTGAKARVNRSAYLRSLSENVASASCRVTGGIDQSNAQAELWSARQDFAAIIDGLTNGDLALGMPGAESRAKTLRTLANTNALWEPLDEAASRIATNSGDAADAATISEGYAPLFEQTVQLAAEISGQYSDPQSLLQSDATVLNFAGRQRALAQRWTRAMCELATGTGDENTADELATTVDLFERTLLALRDGFPEAGINPPPNEQVSNSLNATLEVWNANRGMFDAVLAGQAPSAEDVSQAAALTRELNVAMNNTITLYLIATPGQDGVYRVPLQAYAEAELKTWLSDGALIEAIKAQNVAHADLNEDQIIEMDQQWRAEAGAGGGPLIEKLLSSPVSAWLANQQTATAGFVTEVFVMDNKGLNVAQSVETSDYWQGDEAKWQETYLVGADALHISEVEFDDSTGYYQSQASLPITDPATGEVIGAVTYGINVQNLM